MLLRSHSWRHDFSCYSTQYSSCCSPPRGWHWVAAPRLLPTASELPHKCVRVPASAPAPPPAAPPPATAAATTPSSAPAIVLLRLLLLLLLLQRRRRLEVRPRRLVRRHPSRGCQLRLGMQQGLCRQLLLHGGWRSARWLSLLRPKGWLLRHRLHQHACRQLLHNNLLRQRLLGNYILRHACWQLLGRGLLRHACWQLLRQRNLRQRRLLHQASWRRLLQHRQLAIACRLLRL